MSPQIWTDSDDRAVDMDSRLKSSNSARHVYDCDGYRNLERKLRTPSTQPGYDAIAGLCFVLSVIGSVSLIGYLAVRLWQWVTQ